MAETTTGVAPERFISVAIRLDFQQQTAETTTGVAQERFSIFPICVDFGPIFGWISLKHRQA